METTEAKQDLSVLIIEDHELLSSALLIAFEQEDQVRVVGTAATIADGLRMAGVVRPDVILSDRRLPDGDIDEHMPRLLAVSPASRVLVMTGWPTQRSSLAILDAGAHGIVSKSNSVRQIIDALGRVMSGEVVIPATLTAVLLRRSTSAGEGGGDSLSRRELDVLEALACGESTAEAGRRLCISENTVRNHLARAMLKLEVHDRLGAVAAAIRLGLVSPRLPDSPALGRHAASV